LSKEATERLRQAQAGCTIEGLIDDSLQLGIMPLLTPSQRRYAFAKLVQREKTVLERAQQSVDALSDANQLAAQGLFALPSRIDLARRRKPPLDLIGNQLRIFKQPHDLLPNNFVQDILAYRRVVANPVETGIPAETAIISDFARARSLRCPIQAVAALRAAHETLHNTGRDSPPACVNLVGREPFLRQRKCFFADDRGHCDFNPILSRSFVAAAGA
jgi:hypothetical protein